MTFQRGCSHGYQFPCPVVGCRLADTRPLSEQLFGRNSNSELAAKLYRTNKPMYDAAKREAIEKGLLPREVIPVCLRDPE